MKHISTTILPLILVGVFALTCVLYAQNETTEDYWNQFRGPNGNGKAMASDLPIEFEEIMHNQGTAKALIVDMVRAAGSDLEINVNPLSDSQKRSGFTGANEIIQEWIKENGESIIDTRSGPFEPTDQYVTTYKDGKIYVHVLSWDGKNNITLPAITDRVVKNAWILEHPTADGASWGIVRQHPWGLLIVVPEEYQNGVDDIIVLDIEGDPDTLKKPRLVEADPSSVIYLFGDSAKTDGGLAHLQAQDWIEGWKNHPLHFHGR